MSAPAIGAASASSRHPRIVKVVRRAAIQWNQIGLQANFFTRTVQGIWAAITYYKFEVARLIAQMSLGTGALAIIGGTVVIIGFLTMSTGSLVAVQAYAQLQSIGVEALAGFASAYINVRLACPLIVGVGMSATIGAGATAQLGAMRINEEIDALEVMGIRSIAYLASSRVLAGLVVAVPLYCVAVLAAFTASRVGTTLVRGQSTGVYDHYFNTFLDPVTLIYSFLQAVSMAIVIMLVHTYYGFTASGGPAGVGAAVGRAVRTSLIAAAFVTLLVALAIYGRSGNFHLAG